MDHLTFDTFEGKQISCKHTCTKKKSFPLFLVPERVVNKIHAFTKSSTTLPHPPSKVKWATP